MKDRAFPSWKLLVLQFYCMQRADREGVRNKTEEADSVSPGGP